MAVTTRHEQITMPDGGEMGAYVAVPQAGHGPGVLVLMEIFGVGSYIRRAAERLAELGYVALAPDLYRRSDPGFEIGHAPEDMARAFEAAGKLDHSGAVHDATVALEHLRALPETRGRTAVVGFCLGGTLAYHLAAEDGPDAAVCYYGSGIPDALEAGDRITCPILFHFGAEDQYIPVDQAKRVATASAGRPHWETHIQPDGGHAFDNHDSEMFHRPEAAARAWRVTADFLARELTPAAA